MSRHSIATKLWRCPSCGGYISAAFTRCVECNASRPANAPLLTESEACALLENAREAMDGPHDPPAAASLLSRTHFMESRDDESQQRRTCEDCGHVLQLNDVLGDGTYAIGHYGCPRCWDWTLAVASTEDPPRSTFGDWLRGVTTTVRGWFT